MEAVRRDLSRLVCLWVILYAAGVGGCARVRLNWEMERVEKSYVQLFYDVETAEPETIRRSAEAVAAALDADSIASYRAEEKYQDLLDDSFAAADRITEAAGTSERSTLIALRRRLSSSCHACHEEYRR